MDKLSPGMQQYMEIKEQYKDCILFYRLGDFYELFFDDALIGSKELELTLTGKSCGLEERAPMCGIPFHAADSYIAKMVERGYKVAICEQLEDPALAKGLVKRDVIQVVTPGTITSSSILHEKENNYIASLYATLDGFGICYSDISTGELKGTEFTSNDSYQTLLNELVKIHPSEILVTESVKSLYNIDELKQITGSFFTVLPDTYINDNRSYDLVTSQFNVKGLTSLGLDFRPSLTLSLGILLSYFLETQKQAIKQITAIDIYEIGCHMSLDKATIRNLEITETLYEKKIQGSLLGVLDRTHTAMGSRKMRAWLREPLNNSQDINYRLDGVEELYREVLSRNNIKEYLKSIYDFERLCGKVASGTANGKDLIALRNSLSVLPDIKYELSNLNSQILKDLDSEIYTLNNVYELIDKAIVDEPPFSIKEGGIIKQGYSEELDNLVFNIKDGRNWISNLEQTEKERTGIKNLKVGYNKVFGYYIELSKTAISQAPDNYIRKQTLTTGERYITPELKEMENVVLNAEAKINEKEYQLFTEIRKYIEGYIKDIQATSKAISSLDVLQSFAQVAEKNNYVKPTVDDSLTIEIVKGRHPVIEQSISNGLFVSNDTYLNEKDSSMLLITGPNMSGKSTYMRQTALIVLMAQAGSFVPCEKARIGVCDRLFTRIGASDNLAQGQSTFYVEMSELSYILNNATERSLIILDEIGRGTSTYDGLSIAWASCQFLCNEKIHIRTLFATHYHELTSLEEDTYGVKNLNVDVSEENGNVVFLHKIVSGSASRSYGIHVAKIAGIPQILLDNAENKLKELEGKPMRIEKQISFFDITPDPILSKLRELDLMKITPSKAFQILEELKKYSNK